MASPQTPEMKALVASAIMTMCLSSSNPPSVSDEHDMDCECGECETRNRVARADDRYWRSQRW